MSTSTDCTGTLRAQEHGHQPAVAFEPSIAAREGGHIYNDVAGTVRANAGDNQQAVACETYHCTTEENKAMTLKARDYKDPQVVLAIDRAAYGGNTPMVLGLNRERVGAVTMEDKQPTLQAAAGTSGNNQPMVLKSTDMVVRRLTPLECERLQGFPDGWTDIGEWTDSKGKVHKESSDSARYKALGNSIALPFWFWLLRRIAAQYERPATLGSLFDGIGGFPLCWERCNGKGTAIWASEIEEFPIAVTKKRFPDLTF